MDPTAWIVGGVTILANLIVTTIVGLIVKKKWEEHAKDVEETKQLKEKKLRDERKEDVLKSVNILLQPIEKTLNEVDAELKKNSEGTCAGLRHNLLMFWYACSAKGYRTQDDTEDFTHMYDAYVALGGNSFIQRDVSKWFYDLPCSEQNKGVK